MTLSTNTVPTIWDSGTNSLTILGDTSSLPQIADRLDLDKLTSFSLTIDGLYRYINFGRVPSSVLDAIVKMCRAPSLTDITLRGIPPSMMLRECGSALRHATLIDPLVDRLPKPTLVKMCPTVSLDSLSLSVVPGDADRIISRLIANQGRVSLQNLKNLEIFEAPAILIFPILEGCAGTLESFVYGPRTIKTARQPLGGSALLGPPLVLLP